MPPASFTLELDTTPPAVWFGTPLVVGETLRMPYSVGEPSIVGAEATPYNAQPITATITDDFLVFPLPGRTWDSGFVTVSVEDDVGNARTYSTSVVFSTVRWREVTRVPPPRPRRPGFFVEDAFKPPVIERPGNARVGPPARRGWR